VSEKEFERSVVGERKPVSVVITYLFDMSSPGRTKYEEGMPITERSHSDREVSEFLLRACHDLRGSARAVRTHSELFLKEAGAPETSGFEQRLGFIVEGARRVDLLLDGLASYSVALQTEAASFVSTRMDALLRSVLRKLDKELRDSGAEVVYGELPMVTGNPDRLMLLLENLLRNALAHRGQMPPRIHISACKQPEGWLFAVRDNGPGVEAAFLESIFKPFERLQHKQRWGAGLGLAICRAIVERHGGRIWAESQPESGVTFRFTLPL
jgi:light-regulated signal transduction histidine kinase (bacteriophytochrome)